MASRGVNQPTPAGGESTRWEWSWGSGACPLTSLERLGIRATLLHFYVCDQPGIHPSNKNWKANLLSGLGDKVKSVCLSACLPGLLHADNLGTFLPYGDISTAPRLNLLDPLSPSLGRGSGRR